MKICIVGCGRRCELLQPYLVHFFGGPNLHYVDINKDRAKKAALTTQSTFSTALEEYNFDLAFILTPNGLHRTTAQPFLERGIKTFIDKPTALKWEDIMWMDSYEALITVGYQCRFEPAVAAIKDAIKDDEILFIDCWKHRRREAKYYKKSKGRGTWASDGGVITQQGTHCLDLITFMMECSPLQVGMFSQNRKHNIECEDTAMVTLNYENCLAVAHCTTAMDNKGEAGIKVVTKTKTLECRGQAFERLKIWPKDLSRPTIESGAFCTKKGRYGDYFMMKAVKEWVETNGKLPVSVKSANIAMKIAHTAYYAEHSQQMIDFGCDGFSFGKLGK